MFRINKNKERLLLIERKISQLNYKMTKLNNDIIHLDKDVSLLIIKFNHYLNQEKDVNLCR